MLALKAFRDPARPHGVGPPTELTGASLARAARLDQGPVLLIASKKARHAERP